MTNTINKKENSGDKEAISTIQRHRTTGLVFIAIFILSIFIITYMPFQAVPYEDADEVHGIHISYKFGAYAVTFVIAGVTVVLRRSLYAGSLQRLIHGASASYLLGAILCVTGMMLCITVRDSSLYAPFAIAGAVIVYIMRPSQKEWEKGLEEAEETAESTRWVKKTGHGAWIIGGVVISLGTVLLLAGLVTETPHWSNALPFVLVAIGGSLLSFRRITVVDGGLKQIAVRTSLLGVSRDRIYRTEEFDSIYTRTRAYRSGAVHYNIHLQGPGARLKLFTSTFKDEAQGTQLRISEITGLSVVKPPEESGTLAIIALIGLIFVLPLLIIIYLLLR
jgi:hypothetical protein